MHTQLITKANARLWLKERSLCIGDEGIPCYPHPNPGASYLIPQQASIQWALAEALVNAMGTNEDILIGITDWPQYTEAQMAAFHHAIHQTVTAPTYAILYSRGDASASMVNCLFLMCAFTIHGYMVPASGNRILHLRDEVFSYSCKLAEDLIELNELCGVFGLQKIGD